MILKEKYVKSAKLDNLSGSIIFFANNKSEIRNINKILNQKQSDLFKKNLKNNSKKKEIFSFDISHNQKIIIFFFKKDQNSFEKTGARLFDFFKNGLKKLRLTIVSLVFPDFDIAKKSDFDNLYFFLIVIKNL